MKAVHYLRYYENRRDVKLSPEMAYKEAAKEGFVLDHTGEASENGNKREQTKSAA